MSKKFIKSERRKFLKSAVVASGAASAAAIAPNATAAEIEAPVKVLDKADKGYEENDYIRNYYDRARF